MTTIDKVTVLLLYRSILRLHSKHLPYRMRVIGDAYVKSEFRLHKNVTNEIQKAQFLQGWMSYLTTMKQNIHHQEKIQNKPGNLVDETRESELESLKKFGAHLPSDIPLSDDQRSNLQKLKEEAYNVSNEP